MKVFTGIILSMFLLFCSGGILAANDEKVSLGTVIVSDTPGSHYETGDVPVDEISGFSHVITRKDFEGRMEDLGEVIEKEAGIQIRQAGGTGSFSTVSIRGSSTEQVLIFIDGILLNEAAGGGVDLSNISLSDVESIEIFRGFTPLQFGTSSIGGAVNIKTRRSGNKKKVLSASAGYGSFNTSQAAFFFSHKPGSFDYLVSADFLGSDNDFRFNNNNGTIDDKHGDDRREKRNNSQFMRYNILTKAGYDFSPDTRFSISNQFFGKHQGLPNWNNNENVKTQLTTFREILTGKFIRNKICGSKVNIASRLGYSWKKEKYDDRTSSIGLGEQLMEYTTDDIGFNQVIEIYPGNNFITAVADLKYETYDVKNLLSDETYRPSWRTKISGAIEDNISLFKNSLSVIPGIRYHRIIDSLESDRFSDKRKENRGYTTPVLGIIWNAAGWIRFKANAGQYVREPSFLELFGDRGFFVGNSSLKAEEGLNMDAGFEFSFTPPENIFLQRIRAGFIFFMSDIENLITFIYDARGVGKAMNISHAKIRGIESSLCFDFLKYFSLAGNHTIQKAVNHGEIKSNDGKRLPGRYRYSFNARLEAANRHVKIFYEAHYEDGIYYDDANILRSVPKKEHNAGLVVLWDKFTITIESKNLTNDEVQDFNGYPKPGRSFYCSLKYQL